MSLNPLNELKRRLEDDATPLPKRLCLAKNIVTSHHFPTASKELVIADWLEDLAKENKLISVEFQKVLEWLSLEDLTGELKSRMIQVVSQYVKKNILQNNDVKSIVAFLENPKISSQLCQQINDCLFITTTLLQLLKNDDDNNLYCEKLLNNILRYYKETKKKLDFIVQLLNGENLETLFSYLDTECRETVINVCQNVLFPVYKKSFFISYLKTLIRKDNIEELISEKGDNIQSVLKIMNIFFDFPKYRTEKDPQFLKNFLDVFITCFHKESQVVFAFCIMATNALQMKQDYIVPTMTMKPILFENDEKIIRNLFLNMLEIILKNEVDITVRLTDTLAEKMLKVESKKSFLIFLQAVMMGQLKLEGKLDKTTLQIIKVALKLDPILVEQKMEVILPHVMASKKGSNVKESYKDMLNCLLEILFKLSRGTQFLTQILPSVKNNLEISNTEQLKLVEEIQENEKNGIENEKLKNKLITGNDIFPQECVEMFGKFTADLMFRQSKELLEMLQKDFEVHCLLDLEKGLMSPLTVTLTEVLSSVISSFLRNSKISDHTVPLHIATDFWNVYGQFEVCLRTLGKCVLKHSNHSLLKSFLDICVAYSQLKLLNLKYSNCKLELEISEECDLSVILPCLSKEEWSKVGEMATDEAVSPMDNLLLIKTLVFQLLLADKEEKNSALDETKSYLIKQFNSNPANLENNTYFTRALFPNLDKNQCKHLAKVLIKMCLIDQGTEIFNDVAITTNRTLLNALVLEAAKNMVKCLENCESLTKALNKTDFNIIAFAKETNLQDYFSNIIMAENHDEKIKKFIEISNLLRIPYLEENYQLTAIFVLLSVKKCCQSKKIRKSIDYVIQNIFELSQYVPDLYQIFSVNYIFSLKDTTMMDLLTLKIKTSNPLLIIKCLIERAVKKVKAESSVVQNIVELLISKKLKNTTIESFSDPAFQITCIILPLIIKQRKSITVTASKSILADLQEKLLKTLLETFKNLDFSENSNLFSKTSNIEDSVVEGEDNTAALNAIAAYALTLSRYCETTDAQEIQNLDCLWSGLEFFIQNAIKSISNSDSKSHHVEASIHLLNVTLRHIKKLETHPIFHEKDKLIIQIWKSIFARLQAVLQSEGRLKNCVYMEELGVTIRFVCELVSVAAFEGFIGDLAKLVVLKKPIDIIKDTSKTDRTNHLVSKCIWTQCLKANTVGPKCGAMTKLIYQNCKNLKSWIRQHYDSVHNVANKKRKLEVYTEERELKIVKVHDDVSDILKIELDTLAEVILGAKKITLDYKFLDSIFELQHLVHYILGCYAVSLKCEVTWQSFFKLFEGSVAILNNLLVSREELLEDRWQCYMQCYRALVSTLCENPSIRDASDRNIEEKLAEAAHSIEKLSQAISKRKKQVSRIAAYTVADLCTILEKHAPSRKIRQHLENSIASLIQASDSTYAMAFLKRALAGSVGQMTMTNLYTVYKRYHKYTGNA